MVIASTVMFRFGKLQQMTGPRNEMSGHAIRVTLITSYRNRRVQGGASQGDFALHTQETPMTSIKKIIPAAIAALALTSASLTLSSQAFAGGHRHGHHGHGHGHHGHHHGHGHGFFGHGHHHHHHHRPHFHVYNSCWKWSPYGPINVCYRY
ncbi:hypothetical protein ACH79_09510 [Bradyrhizobium sp. CCBAU 051011]|nr:hypothetical protein ACH79_09510 [Bradyrhizobium sp. CCBAU 051011]